MTWRALMDQLSFEFRRLRRVPVVNFGFSSRPVLDPDQLREDELAAAERIDSLVRDYGRTRRWPALDERDRYYLRERIRFAYDYASIAETTVKHPLRIAGRRYILNDHRRLMEWLLIDAWRESGVLNWLEPFYILAGSQTPAEPDWELHVAE